MPTNTSRSDVDKENVQNATQHPTAASKGILRKGTVTFGTPPKASTAAGEAQRSKSERKPAGARSVAALLEKSSLLTSALAGAIKEDGCQTPHTPSRLQELSSAEPPQGSQTAPRWLGHGVHAQDLTGEEEDQFEFSKDVTSLSEILQGSGISERRLAPEAAMMRKSSVHEFRQLREKRASIFKGAIRVVKTNFKTPASTSSSSTSSITRPQTAGNRPETSTLARTAQAQAPAQVARPISGPFANPTHAHQPASGRGEANGSATCATGAGVDASSSFSSSSSSSLTNTATPSRARSEAMLKGVMTPQRLNKTGTSGLGAKAEMTPANTRAKGVAGALGSLLKDRVAAAATPARAPGTAAMKATPTPSQKCASTQERGARAEQECTAQASSVAKLLDMDQGNHMEQGNQGIVGAGGSQGTPDTQDTQAAPVSTTAPPPAANAQGVTAATYFSAGQGSASAASASSSFSSSFSSSKETASARKYRSRKSELLAEARRRVGVKSPRKKLVQGTPTLVPASPTSCSTSSTTSSTNPPLPAAKEADNLRDTSCSALMLPLLFGVAAQAPPSQVHTPGPGFRV